MPTRTQPLLEREILEELYFSRGFSIQQVADRTGTNVRLVRDSMTHHGLSWRSRSEAMTGLVAAKLTAGRKFAADQGWLFRLIDEKPGRKV